MKIVSKQEMFNRIKEKFPNQPFELSQYMGVTKPVTIRCLNCNEEKTYASCHSLLSTGEKSKKYLCTCYNYNNNSTKHKLNEQKIIDLCEENPDIDFIKFKYREHTKKYCVDILCNKCNQIFNKDWESFLNNQTCPYCYSKHNINTLGFKAILPNEYELVSKYTGTENKVLIKHNCGFIWNVKPHNFVQKINNGYHGCPHCNHKRSHGEMRIAQWLRDKNIPFIEEQIFPWSSNPKFRYDFYLPKQKLIIEYMGEQHYKEIKFFHDTLEERQLHDKIKEKEAREHELNYLVIPYTDFNNIETILSDWFNDYPLVE